MSKIFDTTFNSKTEIINFDEHVRLNLKKKTLNWLNLNVATEIK